MKVDFYQLTRDPAEKVLPIIAQKILNNGQRFFIVATKELQLEKVSVALWALKPDSFLAHQRAGVGDDSRQPILLSNLVAATNGARFVAIADGIWREEALEFERIFYLFPPERTDDARAAWRALAENEAVERRYWKQDGGKWVQGP